MALGIFAFMWAGIYTMGTDSPHRKDTVAMLTLMRERSIEEHAASIQMLASLDDQQIILIGVGQYVAMWSAAMRRRAWPIRKSGLACIRSRLISAGSAWIRARRSG